MKLVVIFCLLYAPCFSQNTITTFYDWQWKPCEVGQARFVAKVTKTDSGYRRNDYFLSNNRLQMEGFYNDADCKERNGSFAYYYSSGILSSTGTYRNNKKTDFGLAIIAME
jgi:hypothetical protein